MKYSVLFVGLHTTEYCLAFGDSGRRMHQRGLQRGPSDLARAEKVDRRDAVISPPGAPTCQSEVSQRWSVSGGQSVASQWPVSGYPSRASTTQGQDPWRPGPSCCLGLSCRQNVSM